MPERGGQKSLEEHNCCNRRTKIYSITGKCGSKNREEKKRISLTLYKVSNGQLLSLSTPAFSIRFWSKSFNRGTQMPNLLGASGVYATLPSPPRLLALLHAFLILDRVVVFGTSMPQLPAGISERRGSFFLQQNFPSEKKINRSNKSQKFIKILLKIRKTFISSFQKGDIYILEGVLLRQKSQSFHDDFSFFLCVCLCSARCQFAVQTN